MSDYLDFMSQLVDSKKTTGENQSEKMVHYTELALSRMKRWNKKGEILPALSEAIKSIDQKQNWIVLTESWCGDAAHAYMFFEKVASENELIKLEWKLRDENLDLMDQYLTNGGRAIPKLIVFDDDGKEIFNWGPRPKHIQERYWQMKKEGIPYDEINLELQKLYNQDKGISMQKEILALLNATRP